MIVYIYSAGELGEVWAAENAPYSITASYDFPNDFVVWCENALGEPVELTTKNDIGDAMDYIADRLAE